MKLFLLNWSLLIHLNNVVISWNQHVQCLYFLWSLVKNTKIQICTRTAKGAKGVSDWPILGRSPMIIAGVRQCVYSVYMLLASHLTSQVNTVTQCNCVTLIKGRHGHSRHFFCLLTNVYGFFILSGWKLKLESFKILVSWFILF